MGICFVLFRVALWILLSVCFYVMGFALANVDGFNSAGGGLT